MFVISRVERAWRQQHHRRIIVALDRGHFLQRLLQHTGIRLDAFDDACLEQLREHPHHDLAVLKHVGDARRRTAVVLKHLEPVAVRPHNVDADNVAIDPTGRINANHVRQEGLVLVDQLFRDDPCPHDLATMVDVVQERIQRPAALLDAARHLPPFGRTEHTGNQVERDQPLRIAALTINREGDADLAEDSLGLALAQLEQVDPARVYPLGDLVIGSPDRPVVCEHFVVHAVPVLDAPQPGAKPPLPTFSAGAVTA